MAHTYTWAKLAQNAYRLNPKSRGMNYSFVPKWEIQSFTSGNNREQKVIVPYKGTNSLLISLKAWGVTQAALHNVTLLFSNVEILTEDPQSSMYFQVEYDGVMYWCKKLDMNKNPLTSRCTCFTGDTKVLLSNGITKTFKELADESTENDIFNVVSYNGHGFIETSAGNCSVKKENAEVIKLIFNTGAEIKCTPDHKLFMTSGLTIEAKDSLHVPLRNNSNNNKLIYVTRIEEIKEKEDVYCLTVPEYGNFMISLDEKDSINVENCADEFFTFAFYKSKVGCLYGPPPRPYKRKTTTRPPRNAQGIIGCCKHVYHAWKVLRDSGLTVN